MNEPQFALYVSSVEGHVVTRFSSHKMGRRPTLIGAIRDHNDPTKITWDTKRIVGIPEAEYTRFGREYNREINAGGLTKRTAKEYAEQLKANAAADRKAIDVAQAADEAKAKASKGADEVVS